MRQTMLMEKYPVFVLEVPKSETTCASVDDVVDYLRSCIAANDRVAFISVFDHLAHTRAIGGEVAANIVGAKNVVFCFGFALPNPTVMAVRPRSIGVCDTGDSFTVSFLEAPMAPANQAMETWVKAIKNR